MNDAVRLAAWRILVIDDNQAIHQDFRKIFGTSHERAAPSAAEHALFGSGEATGSAPGFQVDSAYQGEEGLALVRLAQEQRNPYAVAFVDVRMPPGWDGVETVARIWEHDADIQIVICTAYSDYSWGEMLDKLGRTDRLVILKKPFDTIEVVQLASALTEKWRLARQSRSILEDLERRVAERTHQLVQKADDFRRSERLKGAILESSLDCVVTIDHEGRIVEFNPAAELTFGFTREEALGKEMVELIVPPRLRDGHRQGFARYLATGKGTLLGKRIELAALRADGTEFPAELAITAIPGTPKPMCTGFIRDITARNEAYARINRLNRVYAVLSGINALIVRVSDRDELFREACRIAVSDGGYALARVIEVEASGKACIAASTESDTRLFQNIVNDYNRDPEHSGSMLRLALHDRQPLFSNDVAGDPRIPNRAALTKDGNYALAVLPVHAGNRFIGVLILRAQSADALDEEEKHLLLEMTGNISLALEHMEKEEKVRRLTRVYAVLSGINALIVRSHSRQELFREACSIATKVGGFPLAWIGEVDRVAMRVKPVAEENTSEQFFARIRMTIREDAPEGLGVVGQAVRDRVPVISNDIENDPAITAKGIVQGDARSLAVLPLVVGGEAVGVLVLHSGTVGFFDHDEMKLLNELAGDIAFAIHNIDRTEKLARMTRVNAMLSGINGAIVRINDRQQLLEEACRIAVETGNLPFAWLGVVNASGTELQVVASAGRDDGFLRTIRDRLALRGDTRDSESLSWRAVRERRAVVVNDIAADTVLRTRKAFADRGIRSVAVFPLLIAGRVAGAFALHSEQAGFFDDDEMRLLNEMAANISFALEYMEREDKVRRLTRVNAMLSGINAAIVRIRDRLELFEESCRIAVDHGGFRMAWIGAINRNARTIEPVASAGSAPEYLAHIRDRFSLVEDPATGLTMTARAVLGKKAFYSNDSQNDPVVSFKKEHVETGTRSVASVPLLVADEAVGVLCLYAEEAGFFDAEEMTLLAELARNIAFALEHMEKEEKVERLTRVYAVSSGITSLIVHVDNREELFREACRIAVEDGKFAMAWIGAFDPATQDVTPVAWAGEAAEELTRAKSSALADNPRGVGAVGQSIRARRPIFNNDILTQAFGGPRLKIITRLGFQSHITLPLYEAQAIVATLTLYTRERGFFDQDEVGLLTVLAADISFALQNISRQHKLARMTRVNAVLSGINALIVRVRDRDELFSESCRIAVEVGEFAKAWIGTIEPESRRFRMAAAHGGDPLFFRTLAAELVGRFLAGNGLVARAAATLQPVVANDAASDPEVPLKDDLIASGVRSAAVLPLVVSGAAVGVLVLNSDVQGFFDDEEMALLAEIARNIAFAVDHIGQQDRLDYFAFYDALTGLANRTLFLERLGQYERSAIAGGHKLALFYVDLERFRNINDSLGRPAGDAILKQVTEWLIRNVGDASLLARVGGDQFAIVLPEVKQEGDVARLVDRRIRAFHDHQFRVDATELRLTTRVGVALFPNDGTDAATLLGNAEAALKNAKARGDRHLFYTQKMTDAVAGKLTLENQLRRALDNEEFVLHYQPKISLASGKLTGAEALIRWNDPQTGLVPPGKFIPILEETGLIYDVGRWALRKAIEDSLRWRAAGLPAVRIAVNVSPLQLRNRGFVAEIEQLLRVDALASGGLELEITESLIMEDVKHSIAILTAIRALGVSVAIDDFGTGFSSLSYLAKLPVDILKIDRSFVIDMTGGPAGLALVSTIINLARSLTLKVVAEGVETEEQSRLLRLLRCDEMQGFLFSKAVPREIFEEKFLAPGI